VAALLYEIGVEEVPAGYILPALAALQSAFEAGLAAARLSASEVRTTGSPRRLVLFADGIPARQPEQDVVVLGPPAPAAFDAQGKPTKAAIGFARKHGVALEDLQLRDTERGKYCFVVKREAGRAAAELLPGILRDATLQMPFPKTMRWDQSPERFARPVRWLLALLDDQVLELELFGLRAGGESRGHPFLSPGPVRIPRADYRAYLATLRGRQVLADVPERREFILAQLNTALKSHGSRVTHMGLLDEVTMLVEAPGVVVGRFDEAFLEVPAPILETAMMEHQRYFPVRDQQGRLLPFFLAVSDRGEGGGDAIRAGNERVLRARLADARFFWRQDGQRRLAERVEDLAGVAFLEGLGTYRDKVYRLELLVGTIGPLLGLDEADMTHAKRAARLCKADLVTQMVGEFPSLQGVVGELYARRDAEDETVACAIREHYLPRGADDALPATPVGRVLALAEKLDNLAACFYLGLVPGGSRDPFALRRQAQAVLLIIEANGGYLRVDGLVDLALGLMPAHKDANAQARAHLLDFIRDRLYQICLERGHPHDLVRAVLASGWEDVNDFLLRLEVISKFAKTPDWPRLVEVVERTWNIARSGSPAEQVEPQRFTEDEERELWHILQANAASLSELLSARRYDAAVCSYLALFAEPVHRFFQKVYVNVEDAAVRANRLALLRDINRLFSERIANLAEITTGIQK